MKEERAKRALRVYRGPHDHAPFDGLINSMSFQCRNMDRLTDLPAVYSLSRRTKNGGRVVVKRVGGRHPVDYVFTYNPELEDIIYTGSFYYNAAWQSDIGHNIQLDVTGSVLADHNNMKWGRTLHSIPTQKYYYIYRNELEGVSAPSQYQKEHAIQQITMISHSGEAVKAIQFPVYVGEFFWNFSWFHNEIYLIGRPTLSNQHELYVYKSDVLKGVITYDGESHPVFFGYHEDLKWASCSADYIFLLTEHHILNQNNSITDEGLILRKYDHDLNELASWPLAITGTHFNDTLVRVWTSLGDEPGDLKYVIVETKPWELIYEHHPSTIYILSKDLELLRTKVIDQKHGGMQCVIHEDIYFDYYESPPSKKFHMTKFRDILGDFEVESEMWFVSPRPVTEIQMAHDIIT